ncbi:MAG: Rieske (2Fe-2S) protein [Nitriliruptor sp.]
MVPAGTVDVAASAQVPVSPPMLEVKVAGERVLLLRTPSGLVAFEAGCPHLGQPLRKAELHGTVLTCRHHRHRYALEDGACLWPVDVGDEQLRLREVGETSGRVWVRPAVRTA